MACWSIKVYTQVIKLRINLGQEKKVQSVSGGGARPKNSKFQMNIFKNTKNNRNTNNHFKNNNIRKLRIIY